MSRYLGDDIGRVYIVVRIFRLQLQLDRDRLFFLEQPLHARILLFGDNESGWGHRLVGLECSRGFGE